MGNALSGAGRSRAGLQRHAATPTPPRRNVDCTRRELKACKRSGRTGSRCEPLPRTGSPAHDHGGSAAHADKCADVGQDPPQAGVTQTSDRREVGKTRPKAQIESLCENKGSTGHTDKCPSRRNTRQDPPQAGRSNRGAWGRPEPQTQAKLRPTSLRQAATLAEGGQWNHSGNVKRL